MNVDNTKEIGAAIADFERALEQLILSYYSKGVPIEATWEFPVPVTDAPDWIVTIEKAYSQEAPTYQPTILEE